MTLRRKLTTQIALMCGGVALLGIAAVLSVHSLRQDFSIALRANEQLRHVYTIGMHVGSARSALEQTSPDVNESNIQLHSASAQVDLFDGSIDGGWLMQTNAQTAALRASLVHAEKNPGDVAEIDRTYRALADLSAATRQVITHAQLSADNSYRSVLEIVSALAIVLMCSAILIGIRQYRSVMRPLSRVRRAVARFAAGDFSQRIETAGDAEFASLASDFNHMAKELQALYTELEQRAQLKSRQLVQSERLASVGYLAAGVAHEINNPLGIISGYAERSLKKMEGQWNEDTTAYVRKTMGILCDEAFRCKQITDRLLMLARPGEMQRRNISIASIASEVITSVGGLARFADRRITLAADPNADLTVFANEGEIKQVMLNLLINALEAVPAGSGAVHVAIVREENFVEISVRDNGNGMSGNVCAKIFEPFFTQKRGERPGTGLGLSVAHSIVKDHGGEIEAHSDGIGLGSRFVVRLPAINSEVCNASDA
jgi:signal transduction histidine kinase